MNKVRHSDWIALNKDEYYYIEALHIQGGGGQHLTVSLEIDDPNLSVAHHHHVLRETQRLMIGQTNIYEQTNITIDSPYDAAKIWTSADLTTSMSAGSLEWELWGFYGDTVGTYYSVSKVMYDASGAVTTDQTLSVKNVFTITLAQSWNGPSTPQITATPGTTTSTITPGTPVAGTKPMSGNFKIKCFHTSDPNGAFAMTENINTHEWLSTILEKISKACPVYYEKMEIKEGPLYSGLWNNGRDLLIKFVGLNYDVPSFEVVSSDTSPLVANELNITTSEHWPYTPTRLFYEPLPYEFLYTAEKVPQMQVKVAGIEAVCASLNCGYTYVVPQDHVTGFSLTGTSLSITGTGFPSVIKQVVFSNNVCKNVAVTGTTQITCTAVPVAGSWQPIVSDAIGQVPVETVDQISVPLVLTSVSPNINLNAYGGTTLTITGQNFPVGLDDGSSIDVTLGDGTKCNIVSSTNTQIKCLTERFADSTTTTTLTLAVNGVSKNTLTVTINRNIVFVTAITPAKVSPVLKRIINITIQNFPSALAPSDIEVSIAL